MKIYDITPTYKPNSYYYQNREDYNKQLIEDLLCLVRKGQYSWQEFYDFCEIKEIEWF